MTVSEDLRRFLEQSFCVAGESIRVIYEGVDPALFEIPQRAQGVGWSQHLDYVLSVGNLLPHKNHENLIQALALCRNRYGFSHKLLVAGADWDNRKPLLRQMARDLGLEDDVVFLGPVPYEEMPCLYSGATLLVYPSSFESFGLPVVEAMACGVPVIAANRTSLPEIAGDAAILIDPDDIESMSEAIWTVLSDPKLQAQLRSRGLRRAKQFSWMEMARKMVQALEEALAR